MIRKAGGEARIVSDPDQLLQSDKLLFPGVGAWDAAMAAVERQNFVEPLRAFAASGRPLLGICLGMQLLFGSSDEGARPGLGLLTGRVRRFDQPGLRVPHMGWNAVEPTRQTILFPETEGPQRFYFAHSFYGEADDPNDIAAMANYGIRFACAFAHDNIFGTQFHPEKSHRFGMALLSRFLNAG